jgi:hypothetical protein
VGAHQEAVKPRRNLHGLLGGINKRWPGVSFIGIHCACVSLIGVLVYSGFFRLRCIGRGVTRLEVIEDL